MKEEATPLACSLSDIELKERKIIIEKFKSLIQEKTDLENGIKLKFDGRAQVLGEIIQLIKLERKCCPFLTFDLKIQQEAYPLYLTISSPSDTKDFIKKELFEL